jgi:hypothetical protein
MGHSSAKYLACAFVTLIMVSCSPTMLIDAHLVTDATIMPVKRAAFFFGREIISFGIYYSGKVDRSLALSDILNKDMGTKILKEEIRYEMMDGSMNKSKVYCIGKLGKEDLSLTHSINDNEEDKEDSTNIQYNTFKGTIDYQSGENKWHFLIFNSYSPGGDTSLGYMSNGLLRISIKQVNTYISGYVSQTDRLGYEFILNDEVVGAIDFTGNGRVIIKNDIPAYIKFALANISAALLLKSDLGDSY